MQTIAQLATDLASGVTSSTYLTEAALGRALDPQGEGIRAFTHLHTDTARMEAARQDALRAQGSVPGLLAGVPISIKDLFDEKDAVTLAGSCVLEGRAPALRDAEIVARLRRAGAVIVGRTNMTEFAFSGLGLNPHFGIPANPWDRKTGRIPGGSSSGAAVSVTDRMACAAIGTDTGGSVRIPAALCGIVGFKPTARRVPLQGTWPLSPSLDSIGPLASSVACCALLDTVLAGEAEDALPQRSLADCRFAAPQRYVLDGMDTEVARSFDSALAQLSAAGARIDTVALAELEEINEVNAKGGLVTREAWDIHRELIAASGHRYDPRVLVRIQRGKDIDANELKVLHRRRREISERVHRVSMAYDALVMPTVPLIAPALAPLVANDEFYAKTNLLMLRNPSIANFLDCCGLSIPCHVPGTAPVGLMLIGEHGADRRLLAVGLAVEKQFKRTGIG